MKLVNTAKTFVLGVTLFFIGWWGAANVPTHAAENKSSPKNPLQPIADQVRQLESLLDVPWPAFFTSGKGSHRPSHCQS